MAGWHERDTTVLPALRITLAEPADPHAVEPAWRELESRSDGGFFRSWTWVGCLAARRYPRPVVLEARWRDRVVALALLNRRGSALEPDTLWLGESGKRGLDAVFVEYNGVLVERGWSSALHGACLRVLAGARLGARPAWAGRRVLVYGIEADLVPAARSGGPIVRVADRQVAPRVDLAAIRRSGGGLLDGLSGNTRQQLRRSNRRYAEAGPLRLERAATTAAALGYFDALGVLHQRTWTARGHPGAFANPDFVSFHHALIARGIAAGTIDLLRVAAGDRIVGYLYNFRFRGRIQAYQSGFFYEAEDRQLKPGLTCHALAIEQALQSGCDVYDFLAGDSRYKRSLANAAETLCWLELLPRCAPRAIARRMMGR